MAAPSTSVIETKVVIHPSASSVIINVIMPTQASPAGNSTNNITAKAQDHPIFKADKEGITALVILVAIFAFFLGMILRDLLNKRRTGEFREDKKSCRNFLRLLFCLPCLVCSKDNVRRLWIKSTNLFRSKDNQRAVKKSDQNGIELFERIESGKSTERFGDNWLPKKALGSETMKKKKKSKGKAIDTSGLPQVTEVGVDPDHIDPGKDDEGFTATPVHGAGSGATRHDNALGVHNHGDSSTQTAGSSSTSHHHGAGSSSTSAGHSHWFSSGRSHSNSYGHSHSNSHSYHHGSHSHDYGHTDSGGFDGCDGGD
jgi:hypothetical protein